MSLFNTNRQANLSPRDMYKSKYNTARGNLLLVAIFTAVNLLLLIADSGTYFLFSASIPYILTDYFMFFCGYYPAEYYVGFEELELLPGSIYGVAIAISVVIILCYVLFFFLSKNNKLVWIVVSLVFFSIDSLVMFWYYGISIDMIFDIIFHIWVIVSLSMAIDAHYKLKMLPPDAPLDIVDEPSAPQASENSAERFQGIDQNTFKD